MHYGSIVESQLIKPVNCYMFSNYYISQKNHLYRSSLLFGIVPGLWHHLASSLSHGWFYDVTYLDLTLLVGICPSIVTSPTSISRSWLGFVQYCDVTYLDLWLLVATVPGLWRHLPLSLAPGWYCPVCRRLSSHSRRPKRGCNLWMGDAYVSRHEWIKPNL